MVPTNDFLPFCPTDTGTNLESQANYLVDADRTNGNQPGIASSKLNNKTLRQASFIASQIAQFITNKVNGDVLDNANAAQLLSQIYSSFDRYFPNYTSLLTGTGTFNTTYLFQISSGNATAAATYTVGGVTYTVISTISAGVLLKASGNTAPPTSGTLTKTGGTGDATLTFNSVRAPLYMKVRAVGGGGGGGGSASGGNGGTGGTTTFGTSLVTCVGGGGGNVNSAGGVGGTATLGAGAIALVPALTGTEGQTIGNALPSQQIGSGSGGASPLGGAGGLIGSTLNGAQGIDNTGSGGGGALSPINGSAGSGGGSGGYIECVITNPSAVSTWAWAVGAGGTSGTAGSTPTSGGTGGVGGKGAIYIEEHYQ
jgi:hypothetical protein